MAVTEVILGRSYRTASISADERSYEVEYYVKTDSPLDGSLTVLASGDLPQASSFYAYGDESDTAAFLRRRSPAQDSSNPQFWRVRCEFSTQGDDTPEDPTEEAPEWAIGYETVDIPLSRPRIDEEDQQAPGEDARGGQEIADACGFFLNSAGDPFDPQPTEEWNRTTIEITQNEPVFDFWEMSPYQNSVNSANWLTFPEGLWLCRGVRANTQFRNGTYFWRVTYSFVFDYRGWDTKILDHGPNYIENGVKEPFRTGSGDLTTGNLSGEGGGGVALPAGQCPKFITAKRERIDFNQLPIGNPPLTTLNPIWDAVRNQVLAQQAAQKRLGNPAR